MSGSPVSSIYVLQVVYATNLNEKALTTLHLNRVSVINRIVLTTECGQNEFTSITLVSF